MFQSQRDDWVSTRTRTFPDKDAKDWLPSSLGYQNSYTTTGWLLTTVNSKEKEAPRTHKTTNTTTICSTETPATPKVGLFCKRRCHHHVLLTTTSGRFDVNNNQTDRHKHWHTHTHKCRDKRIDTHTHKDLIGHSSVIKLITFDHNHHLPRRWQSCTSCHYYLNYYHYHYYYWSCWCCCCL